MMFNEEIVTVRKNGANDDEIIERFAKRFDETIAWRKEKSGGALTLKKFEGQIFALRREWDAMNLIAPIGERVWKRLYAIKICPMREDMFADEMALRKLKAIAKAESTNDDIDMRLVENRPRTFSEYR